MKLGKNKQTNTLAKKEKRKKVGESMRERRETQGDK